MGARAAERETAIAAADETCPRCGARRDEDQRYCLDCGLQLPEVTGRLAVAPPALDPPVRLVSRRLDLGLAADPDRRRWRARRRRSRLTANGRERQRADAGGRRTVTLATPGSGPRRRQASTPRPCPGRPSPRHRRAAEQPSWNGRFAWPSNENGWTIVLVSYPKTTGAASAHAKAAPGREGRPRRRPACSTRRTTRACNRGIWSCSPASTRRRPMPTPRSRPPARRASPAPIPARSRAEPAQPAAGVNRRRTGKEPLETPPTTFTQLKTFVTAPPSV